MTNPEEPSQKKTKQLGWLGPAGMPLSVPEEIQETAGFVMAGSETKEAENRQRETAAASSGGECSGCALTAATILHRPLPLRCPPCPKKATPKEMSEWNLERRRISRLAAQDPMIKIVKNLPTLRETKDPDTAEAVATSRDKAIVMAAARSVVSVSSVALDKPDRLMNFFLTYSSWLRVTTMSLFADGKVTGIVLGWNEAKKCARILTCFDILCGSRGLTGPKPKLHVRLPNKAVSEGQLLFYNAYYDIALVEIIADTPLEIPSFGSSPNYGQEVFVLARDSGVEFDGSV